MSLAACSATLDVVDAKIAEDERSLRSPAALLAPTGPAYLLPLWAKASAVDPGAGRFFAAAVGLGVYPP